MSAHPHLDARLSLAPHEALARDLIRERTVGHVGHVGHAGHAAGRRGRRVRPERPARLPRAADLLRRWADRLDPVTRRPAGQVVHRVEHEPRPWAPARRHAPHHHT